MKSIRCSYKLTDQYLKSLVQSTRMPIFQTTQKHNGLSRLQLNLSGGRITPVSLSPKCRTEVFTHRRSVLAPFWTPYYVTPVLFPKSLNVGPISRDSFYTNCCKLLRLNQYVSFLSPRLGIRSTSKPSRKILIFG